MVVVRFVTSVAVLVAGVLVDAQRHAAIFLDTVWTPGVQLDYSIFLYDSLPRGTSRAGYAKEEWRVRRNTSLDTWALSTRLVFSPVDLVH